MNADISITEGGPNVFADLGLPDADELMVKAQLALQIARIRKDRGHAERHYPFSLSLSKGAPSSRWQITRS